MTSKSQNLTYKSWYEMRRRCRDERKENYRHYGGRRITVCKRWQKFENFVADMGERPSKNHSIDRYPNKDGNYEPTNCRWATRKEQGANRSTNHRVVVDGKTVTLRAVCELLGKSYGAACQRIYRGASIEEAIK